MNQGNQDEVFAEVWLPLALPKALTYSFPAADAPVPGGRVIVPLKGAKLYTGFVWKTGIEKPEGYKPRSAADTIDNEPYLDSTRMKFLEWMAGYYCCSIGEVLLAAVPSAHRLSSESQVQLHPDFDFKAEDFSGPEAWLFQNLKKQKKLPLSEIVKALGSGASWLKKIRQFQAEGKVLVFDELVEVYKPRTKTFITLAELHRGEEALDELFLKLEKKPEEEAFLLSFLNKTRFSVEAEKEGWKIAREDLALDENGKKILARLLKRGIFILEKQKVQAFGNYIPDQAEQPVLSEEQSKAFDKIQGIFETGKTCLLMGVTGSGKTEIYINLISKTLAEGKQCLFLLPEIAITVQIVARLRKVFGEAMGVYHSRASLPEKMEVWEGLRDGRLNLVIGVRSSVFLPFRNLGLLIADEEHDASYKQTEPAPRYHGRDSGIVLAGLHGAKVLLGSATPSVESYYKASSGKWEMVLLENRFGDSKMPEIRFTDMKVAAKTLRIRLDISEDVLDGFCHAKEAGHQSILFQNRRGYAPYMECQDCGWVPYCPSCDVSLTLHQSKYSLSCHYCGHKTDVPAFCHACGSVNMKSQGYGTEKLEESLVQLLPGIQVARMDQDTTQSRKSFDQILLEMANGKTDILVGTQMVTKGLDFENVTFVAVFDVDRVLHYPDFRANERTFQLLSQIAGRAGRRKVQGHVLIQTRNPAHPVLRMVAARENHRFYQEEIQHRKDFGFPPFSRMIRVTSRHPEEKNALLAAETFTKAITKSLGSGMVFGPETPVIARLRNQYIFHISIKIPETASLQFVKSVIIGNIRWMESQKEHRGIQWICDVDPN